LIIIYNFIVFLELALKKKVGAEVRSLSQLRHFLSEFILTQTTESATTPRTPTMADDQIRPVIKPVADPGAVVGNTEKMGS
jgi:hypothetical protein